MNYQNGDCAELEQSLGAFVLGSLDADDRDVVAAHVSSCARCARTVSEFAPMPAMLNLVAEMDSSSGPPPVLLERILAAARSEATAGAQPKPIRSRANRRWLALGAAAVAAAVVIVFGFSVLRSAPAASSVSATNPSTGVAATATLLGTATGTQVTLTLNGVQPAEHCQLVAVGADGRREVAATWVASYDGEAQVTGTTSLSADQIMWFNVVTSDGQTLLRIKGTS